MASSLTGTSPFCQAKPSSNTLAVIAFPVSLGASAPASIRSSALAPSRPKSAASKDSLGKLRLGSRRKAPVMVSAPLTTARVRSLSIAMSCGVSAATTRSQPITASAWPAVMRAAPIASVSRARVTWLMTDPPFWASPVWSITVTARPSIWAAMAMRWPMVTTPVPPIPATRTRQGRARPLISGVGRVLRWVGIFSLLAASGASAALPRRRPSTVTRAGQNPFTQLSSLLHDAKSMRRFSPKGVATGTTDRQWEAR